ncbi:MAG TPA: hypothetical protein VGD31_10175 [Sphingobacteriaceae bacterium]
MKKIFFLLAMASFQIFALAGCGNTTEKVFKVNELVDKVTVDKDGWKGREVTVSGYVMHTSGSGGANGYVLNMKDQRNDESERYVVCKVPQGDLPEGIAAKTIEVKGKIGSVTMQNYLNLKSVMLDSCELKK